MWSGEAPNKAGLKSKTCIWLEIGDTNGQYITIPTFMNNL